MNPTQLPSSPITVCKRSGRTPRQRGNDATGGERRMKRGGVESVEWSDVEYGVQTCEM